MTANEATSQVIFPVRMHVLHDEVLRFGLELEEGGSARRLSQLHPHARKVFWQQISLLHIAGSACTHSVLPDELATLAARNHMVECKVSRRELL